MVLSDWFNAVEVARLTQRSDLRAVILVASNWALIMGALGLVAMWSNPLTWVVSVLIVGARQLGLAILMHEAGHSTLFKRRVMNRFVGQWLCAYPILSDLNSYAASHREHHKLAGSYADPDLPNYRAYPVSRESFRRKMLRDLTGQTGIRNLRALLSGDGGDLMVREGAGRPPIWGGILFNGGLLGAFALLGQPQLYLIWVIAYLLVYPFLSRLRQLAEHAAVADLFDADPRQHTRTTLANPIERLLVCPNHVNYHCEHHFAPAVPGYRLAELHKLLAEKGFYAGHQSAVARGYGQVLRLAVAG